jgi:hypothetical protein
MDRITSSIVPVRERVDFWEDLVASQLPPLRFEAAGELPFRGEMQAQAVSGLAVVMISGQGVHGSHGRAEVSDGQALPRGLRAPSRRNAARGPR